jgi:heme/copper-type cytochrome/quinol oxidase subunit 2
MIMNKRIILPSLIMFSGAISAQQPTGVPGPNSEPIDLSNPADIIIYIVLPLCAVLLYFVWRKNRRNKGNQKK